MVEKMESLRSQYSFPIVSLESMTGLSMSSYMRWKRRIHRGGDPVKKPGAKKTPPIDLGELKQQIGGLTHGPKRTTGTGRLYRANSHRISRREFNAMVKEVRSHTNRLKAADQCQVVWLRPNLAWALDGLEYSNHHVQNLQDLCSRYKFLPLTTNRKPCGKRVADHLSRQLARFGPPLFIKRDNGTNLNDTSVNDHLSEMIVIPINSPFYTASYNGAIEHSQGEIKSWLGKSKTTANTTGEMALLVENAAHALNHNPRRSLSGKNSCRAYFISNQLRYNKRQRKEIYDWIRDLAVDIPVKSGKNEIDPTAWRVAARKWMEKHNLIIIRKPVKVLPDFSLKNCHN